MPNPSAKVAAMASMFQQQQAGGEGKDEDNAAGTVKKGRQSLPVFGEAGFVKHKKAALKRTNSQKDRFSNARMMFEKKGSGDNLLDTSRSSIMSAVSNTSSIMYSANKTSTRQSMSISSVEEDEDTNLAHMKNYPTKTVDQQDEIKVPVYDELTLSNKENIFHSAPPPTTSLSMSLTSQSQVLSPNRQLKSPVHSKSVTSHFLELESKSPPENSSPPPLPSLPPPPLMSEDKPSLLGEDEIVLNSPQQSSSSSCEPDFVDIIRKLSFSHNTDLVIDTGAVIPRSDSQDTLLEYADLCDSLPSVEYIKMEEEFDRLADMTDLGQLGDQADDDHNNEDEKETVFQVSEESLKPPNQMLETIKISKFQDSNVSSDKSNIKVAESTNLMRSDIEVLKRDHDPTNSLPDTPSESVTGSSSINTLAHELLVRKGNQVVPTISTNDTYLNDDDDVKLVTVEEVIDVQEIKRKSFTPIQNKSMNKSQTVSEDGNTSSLGSSLVGQSVSSWLGTPGSVSAQSIETNPSPKTGADNDSSKYITSTEESSDYVSGDSCELGSSSSAKVESKSFPLPQNGLEGKIHYLSDGNFWVEGPPLVPTEFLEDSPDVSKLYHPPTMVKFSTSPVKIYSTYTDEEYDRSNDDIDPAAASAEYELEKRVEKMKTFEVDLTKGEEGLGLSILGMGVGVETGVEKLGIFIKTITAGGAAAKDGRIQVNDQIISVDGSSLVGVTQAFAASVLRNTAGLVQFVVGRDEESGESEVAQLIRQSVQADMEGQPGVADEEENDSPERVSLSSSSSVEGELSFSCEVGETNNSSYEEEESSVPPLPEGYQLSESAGAGVDQVYNYESTHNVDPHGVDISQDNIGQDISVEQENLDCTASPEASAAEELADKDVTVACCSHKYKYETLLVKYEQALEAMGQMKRNMSIVTEQLVSRDQLFSIHMARLREVFGQLEEKLNDTDKVVACQQTLWSALEPRGVLRRKPFIPTTTLPEDIDLPASSLDLTIPPTPLLDTSLARDRVSLVHRATLARKRGRQSIKSCSDGSAGSAGSATTNMSASRLGERTEKAEKVVGGSGFRDELRKTLMMNNRRNVIPGSEGATVSSTPPLSPTRASSLPCSPTRSLYSSSSSLQSVPGNLDGPTEFKREKKRLSSKSLWQKARRRLSSR